MKGRNAHGNKTQNAIFLIISISVVTVVGLAALFFMGQIYWMGKEIDQITWQLPATIYAEPPSLTEGQPATSAWLEQYLQRLNYVETSTKDVQPGQYANLTDGFVFRPKPLRDEETSPIRVTFSGNRVGSIKDLSTSEKLSHITLEPVALATLFGSESEKRTLVKLDDLPPHVVDAVIAIEDRRFFKHSGVDIVSVARALVSNVRGSGPFQGGSTITQQLVKNLYLSPEKTLRRKASEAMMAILMEAKYSKEEILELYLNEVYLGQRGPVSIKGIGEASRFYFKKDASLLTLPEAALIAGLIQAPSRYDPHHNPEKAKLRRDSVLLAMKDVGILSPAECDKYIASEPDIKEPDTRTNRAPYFLTLMKRQLQDQFSTTDLQQRDYRIISTLDYDMQLAAQQSLTEGLVAIEKMRRKTNKTIQASLISIDAKTGKIRAFVGGRDFSGSQFDRLTQAHRQPGSSFKPFVYAAAIETAFQSNDRFYTSASLVEDEPWSVKIDRTVWQPQNYNGGYNGVVSLRQALAKSMNIATAKVANDIGFHRVYEVAQRMGFKNVKPYPSIALGAFEVTPYQLIQAYTAFANGGKLTALQSISRVVNAEGENIRQRQLAQSQVLHPETAYIVTDMLKTVMSSGTGASYRQWGIKSIVAGKTGTTNDQKDAWFVGYTPDLITLVWVGYDDNTPVRMTGAQAALPIWSRYMKRIQNRIPVRDFPRPPGVVEKMIDPYTGLLASYSCLHAVRELFVKGTEPLRTCSESDHFLPLDYFLGPEPRIQQASYTYGDYNDYNYEYADISYDQNRYSYTNYGDEDVDYDPVHINDPAADEVETKEPIDYSDESFPEETQQIDGTEDQTYDRLNDYEASEPPESSFEEQDEVLTGEQNANAVYLAPKATKKKKIFTNKDIPEAESTTTSEQPREEQKDEDDEY